MAEFIDFPQSNFTFVAPAGLEDQVGDLRVYKGPVEYDNGPAQDNIISKWKLSDKELQLIKHTKCVWLSIMGHGMPPVCVMGSSPFIDDLADLPKEKEIRDLSDIDDTTPEGKLLLCAVGILMGCPEIHVAGEMVNGRQMTPWNIIDLLHKSAAHVYGSETANLNPQ